MGVGGAGATATGGGGGAGESTAAGTTLFGCLGSETPATVWFAVGELADGEVPWRDAERSPVDGESCAGGVAGTTRGSVFVGAGVDATGTSGVLAGSTV